MAGFDHSITIQVKPVLRVLSSFSLVTMLLRLD
jgi:hypothetical protein